MIDATVSTEQNPDDAALVGSLSESAGEGDEPSEVEAGSETAAPSEEDLAYARSQGWVEKDKFRGDRHGDKNEWVDATTFAKRAREINPIINARNKDLVRENQELRRAIEQNQRDTVEALNMVRAQAAREYTGKLAELKARRAAAIDDGDGATVNQIEEEMAALPKPAAPVKKEAAEQQHDPALVSAGEAFAGRNGWYGTDAEKTGLANAVARTLLRERPDLRDNPDFFAEFEYQLKADHPDMFKSKATPRMVDGGGRPAQAGSNVKKSLADLPKDAQEIAKRFVRNGYLKNEQEYVEQWFAERAKEA